MYKKIGSFLPLSLQRRFFADGLVSRFTSILGIDILVKAMAFILLPFFLHYMSQEDFGKYNYLVSIVQTFSLVCNLGLYVPLSKLYHTYDTKAKKGQLLFTIVFIICVFMMVATLIAYWLNLDYKAINLLFANNIDYSPYRGIVFLALLVTIFSFILTTYFYTSEKIRLVKSYNLVRIVVVNLISLLALYIIKENKVQVRFFYGYLSELILLLLFGFYMARVMLIKVEGKMIIKCLQLGLPIMISAAFGIIINFGDKYLLQRYGSLKDLSIYYLALSFAGIIPLVFTSLQNVWLPIFMKEKDITINFSKTKKLIKQASLSFVFLSFLIWALLKFLLLLSFIPAKYNEVVYILPILLISQIVASITPLLSNYLVYLEKVRLVALLGFFISISTIVIGFTIVPIWGIYGAGLTSLATNLIYLVAYYFIVLRIKNNYSNERQ